MRLATHARCQGMHTPCTCTRAQKTRASEKVNYTGQSIKRCRVSQLLRCRCFVRPHQILVPRAQSAVRHQSLRRFLMAAVHHPLLLVRISLFKTKRQRKPLISTSTRILLWTIRRQRQSATNVVDKSRGSME